MDGLIALALAKKAIGTSMGDIATNLIYKGTVNSIEDLPSDASAGDVYGVGVSGLYAYNGTSWGAIGRQGPKGDKGDKGDKGEGGSLPEPTSDGVALIGVDGEWVQSEGYGYISKTVLFDWDQDTSVSSFNMDEIVFYLVSDHIITEDEINSKTIIARHSNGEEKEPDAIQSMGELILGSISFAADPDCTFVSGTKEAFAALGVDPSDVPSDGTYATFGLEKVYLRSVSTINPLLIPELSEYEVITNKITSLSSSSTDTQYPTAKAVYDLFNSIVDGNNMTF